METNVQANVARTKLLLLGCLLGLQACIRSSSELVLELLDSTGGVNILELASVKRMAFTANVDFQLFANTSRLKRVPATAGDGRFLIIGMDAVFHG